MKKSNADKNITGKKGLLKKLISVTLIIFLIAASIPVIINIYVVAFSSRYILTPEEYESKKVDCVMVLGAGVWDDGPSHLLEERLNRGIEVYKSQATDRLLMSGDHGRIEYDEVNVMKSFAIDGGAVPNEVFMDHAGFSTYESMYRARDVFDVESLIIVTQEYHLYRAIYDARKLGLEAYGVVADGQYNFSAGTRLYNSFRESLARCKDVVWCIVQPEPTYLGEVIPISASGNLTDDKTT
ncbi:MAG: YdcF family protein [Clostridia bacterium]|nr:YdcF family protein [Clostridia bacterium]